MEFKFRTFKYTQTESAEEVVGLVQVDTKGEMNLMKKMMQNKIEKLQNEKTEVEKDLDEERKKKDKILQNARRKIKQMQNDMDELRKNTNPEAKTEQPVRPLPDGKASNGTFSFFLKNHPISPIGCLTWRISILEFKVKSVFFWH